MGIRQAFYDFMNKHDYDFEKQKQEIFGFHPQLKLSLTANGFFFHNYHLFKRFFPPIIASVSCIAAMPLLILNIVHSLEIGDLTTATECFSYSIIVITIPTVQFCNMTRHENVMRVFKLLRNDFEESYYFNEIYRKSFLENQLRVWKLSIAWYIFVFIVFVCYLSLTILDLFYYSLFATHDEHSQRRLMFPMWLPKDDPYRSPNFEIMLVYEVFMLMFTIQSFAVYVGIMMHVLLHCLGQIDLIILALDHLFDNLDEEVTSMKATDKRRIHVKHELQKRFRQISEWHNNVLACIKEINYIYSPITSYQLMATSFVLCLNAYQVAEGLDNGKFDFLFAILFAATAAQVWIPCYLGTLIEDKGASIADACWQNGWEKTKLTTLIRFELQLVMMMSQVPLIIQPTGVKNLSLQTFSQISSSAYSYFNMLRQLQ